VAHLLINPLGSFFLSDSTIGGTIGTVFLAASTIGGTSIRRNGISDMKVYAKVLQAATIGIGETSTALGRR